MTIKTFDANRVGGGTFSLVQDPTTGEYKLKEVGFVKLPPLKLPEIEQAAPVAPGTSPSPSPSPDPDTGTGGGGSDGGSGEQDQRTSQNFDYTGTKEYQNIQNQATQLSNKLQTMIDNQEAQERAAGINAGVSSEGTPLTTADVSSANQEAQERAAGIGPQKQFASQMIAERKAAQSGPKPGISNPRKPGASFDNNQNNIPEASQALDDEYYGFDNTTKVPDRIMERTSEFGALPMRETTAQVPDRIMQRTSEFGALKIPEESKTSIKAKAKDILSNIKNVKPVSLMVADAIGNALVSPQQRALNKSNKDAISSLGYKTNFELGIGTDPARIAGNPAENVFAGMNIGSARGNIMTGSAKRVKTRETIGIQRVEARYGKNSQKAKDFRAKTETFKNQRQEVLDRQEKQQAAKNKATMNQGPPSQSGGGGDPGCFIKGTLITMFDGSKKPVEKVDLGDNVAVGGKVFAVGKFLNTELYDYKGIKVSGSHMVNEDGTWLRVRDTKHGKSLGDDLNTVYVFGSENRRILIDDILFTDYFEVSEQDQLINNEEDFFDNWKSYGNTINEHNVNTLNAN